MWWLLALNENIHEPLGTINLIPLSSCLSCLSRSFPSFSERHFCILCQNSYSHYYLNFLVLNTQVSIWLETCWFSVRHPCFIIWIISDNPFYSVSGQKSWGYPWHTSSWTLHPKPASLVGFIYSESDDLSSPLLLIPWWQSPSAFTWQWIEDSKLLPSLLPCFPFVHPFSTQQPQVPF